MIKKFLLKHKTNKLYSLWKLIQYLLKPLSGIKAGLEEIISNVFTKLDSGFFKAIGRITITLFYGGYLCFILMISKFL